MKKITVLVCMAILAFVSAAASEPKSYEMPRTQVLPIKDSKADRQYELYVKLPEGYTENPDTKYPVIYTTDAVWHMDMLSGATEYLMPDAILVGISWQIDLEDDRAHASRSRDYTIIKYETVESPTGEAGNHLSFIRDDVIPYVESNYRTQPEERTYFGYSAGGEFGSYILFAEPGTFNHYVLGSPAFDQQSYVYIDELEAETRPRQHNQNVNVFLSVGELERPEMVAFAKEFESMLRRRSQTGLAFVGLEIIENSDHGTAFPETVIRGVKWLSALKSE